MSVSENDLTSRSSPITETVEKSQSCVPIFSVNRDAVRWVASVPVQVNAICQWERSYQAFFPPLVCALPLWALPPNRCISVGHGKTIDVLRRTCKKDGGRRRVKSFEAKASSHSYMSGWPGRCAFRFRKRARLNKIPDWKTYSKQIRARYGFVGSTNFSSNNRVSCNGCTEHKVSFQLNLELQNSSSRVSISPTKMIRHQWQRGEIVTFLLSLERPIRQSGFKTWSIPFFSLLFPKHLTFTADICYNLVACDCDHTSWFKLVLNNVYFFFYCFVIFSVIHRFSVPVYFGSSWCL